MNPICRDCVNPKKHPDNSICDCSQEECDNFYSGYMGYVPVYSSKIERAFIKFLFKHGVYKEFMHNLYYTPRDSEGRRLCAEKRWRDYCDLTPPVCWITNAFCFDTTETDFCSLSIKWQEIVCTLH